MPFFFSRAVDQTISLIEEDEALGRLQEAGEDLVRSSSLLLVSPCFLFSR